MTTGEGFPLAAAFLITPDIEEPNPAFATAPAGDRYYRHPGDVLRLVLAAMFTLVLIILVQAAAATTDGITTDLSSAAAQLPLTIRQAALATAQVGAIAVPTVTVVLLLAVRRLRRLATAIVAAVVGALLFALVDAIVDLPDRAAEVTTTDTWLASSRFPSSGYVAAVAAAAVVGKPWLGRSWRRAVDVGLAGLLTIMAIAGRAGLSELVLALAVGVVAGAALLVIVGAPNRRPTAAAIATALQHAGLPVVGLELARAAGGRAQLYEARTAENDRFFAKVYGRDTRDADLLYRGYRALFLRGPNTDWPSLSLQSDVEHETLMLLLANRAGVRCPKPERLTRLPDGSMVLAMQHLAGRRLDAIAPADIDRSLLDDVWRETDRLHHHGLAHRALRAANVLVVDDRPVIIDFGFAKQSVTPRMQAIDRAELLASTAALVGPERAVAAAADVLEPHVLADALPYLQPLALSAATRKAASKGDLKELRAGIAAATGEEAAPLERLVRVRARTLVTITALVAAFYVLLPQLANVGDSFTAIRSANWAWLLVSAVTSLLTYVAAAVSTMGSVPSPIPFLPTVAAQVASSFVNRVTPANVGGMALNIRFLQKAGVPAAQAITGVGLNSAAGAVVHVGLLVLFLTWAGQSGASAFKIPATSTLLVAVAVVLAAVGLVLATRWGRRLVRTHVARFIKQGLTSVRTLARSPVKLALLLGGSTAVTLAYIASFGAAVTALGGDVGFAQIGAVYLGASIIAAAAPTPGGLGAIEAALVAGLTGVGMEPGPAVAAVLSYRLVTYWLPVLPGWISFHVLEHRELI